MYGFPSANNIREEHLKNARIYRIYIGHEYINVQIQLQEHYRTREAGISNTNGPNGLTIYPHYFLHPSTTEGNDRVANSFKG